MNISTDFPGGNIKVLTISGDYVRVECDLRDTEGDWFYWAFCVEGAGGRTLTFDFGKDRIGYFGPAVSHDLKVWNWAGEESVAKNRHSFTYTFTESDPVYFAHNMIYSPERFDEFLRANNLKARTFALTDKGNEVKALEIGEGDKVIVLHSRHHCCESTGTYVLEGVLQHLLTALPKGYRVLAIPFMDIDGVINGDQGKNRRPHDHNRDYIDQPIYPSVRELMKYAADNNVKYQFDFHSPYHIGGNDDKVFLVRNLLNEAGQDEFAALFKEESEGLSFRYFADCDIMPNTSWNKLISPTSTKFFSNLPTTELSFTLETAYFGTKDNAVSQNNLLKLGNAFGRALCRYIERH
ncbi:MAG: hypothetical protein ACOX5C_06860 [Acutalibacteraceae bacterium]|jgi:hypothetical protein